MDYKKYLQLENLVMTGGDPTLIEQLREELGINPSPRETVTIKEKPKKLRRSKKKRVPFIKMSDKFDVGQYKKWKREGVPDRIIAEELGISLTTLRRIKIKHGLSYTKGGILNVKHC